MTDDLEFGKYIVLSTSHIPEDTADRLTWDGSTSDEYGWWLYVPEENNDENDGPDYMALNPLFDLARKHGCFYIRLDSDGPVVAGLEVYSW